MKPTECLVNKIYETKNGEFCVGFKFKFDDICQGDKEGLRAAWREGIPMLINLELFQPEVTDPTPAGNE
jgi:hypothetical protein